MDYLIFKITNMKSKKKLNKSEKFYYYNKTITSKDKDNLEFIIDSCKKYIDEFMESDLITSYDIKDFIADTRFITRNFDLFTSIEPELDIKDMLRRGRSDKIPIIESDEEDSNYSY